MWNTALGIKNCKQIFSLRVAFTTQKKATHTAEMKFVLGVAIFWVVNASNGTKSCLQFSIPTGSGAGGEGGVSQRLNPLSGIDAIWRTYFPCQKRELTPRGTHRFFCDCLKEFSPKLEFTFGNSKWRIYYGGQEIKKNCLYSGAFGVSDYEFTLKIQKSNIADPIRYSKT